jgi:hypothetical protein
MAELHTWCGGSGGKCLVDVERDRESERMHFEIGRH